MTQVSWSRAREKREGFISTPEQLVSKRFSEFPEYPYLAKYLSPRSNLCGPDGSSGIHSATFGVRHQAALFTANVLAMGKGSGSECFEKHGRVLNARPIASPTAADSRCGPRRQRCLPSASIRSETTDAIGECLAIVGNPGLQCLNHRRIPEDHVELRAVVIYGYELPGLVSLELREREATGYFQYVSVLRRHRRTRRQNGERHHDAGADGPSRELERPRRGRPNGFSATAKRNASVDPGGIPPTPDSRGSYPHRRTG
jgi:hypothetical protein